MELYLQEHLNEACMVSFMIRVSVPKFALHATKDENYKNVQGLLLHFHFLLSMSTYLLFPKL